MKYVSTRGQAPVLEFGDVLLAGLATDGGLYVPDTWPAQPDLADPALVGAGYLDVATAVMAPYVAPSITGDELRTMVSDAYATFTHPEICPVTPLGADGLHLLELFWGPTIAFKDVALQLLGPDVLDPIAERWRGRAVLAEAVAVTLATFDPTADEPACQRW